jgi:RHS repeat-associated protein
MTRIRIVLLSAAVAVIGSLPAHAAAGQQQYIVKLKYQLMQPNASAPAAVRDVVPSLGGHVDREWPDRIVVTLPDAAIEALRQHAAVKYFQRVVTGPFTTQKPQSVMRITQSLTPRTDSSPPTWSSGTYSYDSSGNITGIGSNTYVYDHLSRLTSSMVSGNSETYTYDPFGNLTYKITTVLQHPPLPIDLATSLATNRLSGESYDTAGNDKGLLNAPQANFYDAMNMMIKSVNSSNVPTYYAYTADDERIAVLPCPGGTLCTDQFWTISLRDLNGRVIRQYESPYFTPGAPSYPAAWKEDYVYRDGVLLGAERPAEEGGRRQFHVDHLGTPRLVTGAGGQRIAEHDYYPFGVEITSMRQEVAQEFDRVDPMQFTGHERDYLNGTDTENANYNDYMHARYTVPQWGRFLSPDPMLGNLLRAGSWNRYTYVMNNPTNYIDPDGLVWKELWNALKNTFAAETTVHAYTDDFIAEKNRQFALWMLETNMRWAAASQALPHGGGPLISGSAEGGVIAGGGVTVAGGAGLFYDEDHGISPGVFGDFGGALGVGPRGLQFPEWDQFKSIGGGFAGLGGGGFITNARNVKQLKGPFSTYSVNWGFGTPKFGAQFAKSGKIWIFGVTPFGPSIGVSGSGYPTNTWTSR